MTVSYNPGDLVRMKASCKTGVNNPPYWMKGAIGRLVGKSRSESYWNIRFDTTGNPPGSFQASYEPTTGLGGTHHTTETHFTLFARGGGPDDPFKE